MSDHEERPKTAENLAWEVLVSNCHHWASNHMDQWEKFTFDTEYGPVYVTITHETSHPDSFDKVDMTEIDRGWWPTIYGAGIKADLDGQSRSPPESLTKDQMSVWLAGYDR